ncbi:MAG: RNA polymerase sigma factor [Ignavibacteria bacterium]|nr:RNA polymerase sigma factor [Ignavibacteria bacterium]
MTKNVRDTFDDIYHAHKVLVYNLALSYLLVAEDAQEITQDVFVSVYQGLKSFKEQSSITTWVYRITINKSLDFLKAKQRKKRFGFFTSLFHPETNELKYDKPTFDHPGVQLENREAVERIFKCIHQLPDNQKTALLLSKIEDKTQAEIAEIMNLSAKAVESLIQRAKQNLSAKLSKSEG